MINNMSKSINPGSITKLKKDKSQYKFLPIQNASAPPDEKYFPDAFMNVLDYVKLCIPKTRYLEVQMGLIGWADQILYAIRDRDKAKFEEITEDYLFRIKLIVPVDKFDFIKPKFDELFGLFLKIF